MRRRSSNDAGDRRVAALERRIVGRGGRRKSDQALTFDAAIPVGPSTLVLVVDDFSDGREMVAEFLRFKGFRVEEAADGRDAVAKGNLIHPDIVLLDLALPDMDGLDVAHELRKSPVNPIEIVVMTALVMGNVRQRVSAAGIRHFVPKPCDLQHVARLVYAVATANEHSAAKSLPCLDRSHLAK